MFFSLELHYLSEYVYNMILFLCIDPSIDQCLVFLNSLMGLHKTKIIVLTSAVEFIMNHFDSHCV